MATKDRSLVMRHMYCKTSGDKRRTPQFVKWMTKNIVAQVLFFQAWRAVRARSLKTHPLQLSPHSVGDHREMYEFIDYYGAAPRTLGIRSSRHPGLRLGDVL